MHEDQLLLRSRERQKDSVGAAVRREVAAVVPEVTLVDPQDEHHRSLEALKLVVVCNRDFTCENSGVQRRVV
jgi:hypothetical protein